MTATLAAEPHRLRAPPPRRRAVAVSAVLLGHVALLLLVWQERFATSQGSEARRTIAIRLIPDRAPNRPEPPARQVRERLPAPAAPNAEAARSFLVPVPPVSEAAGPPAAPANTQGTPGLAGATTGAAAGMAAGAPGHAASGPLALTPSREVLRGSLANVATSDPRSNSPKPTFEERIAMGLDPDVCIKLERLPDGTVRRTLSRLVQAESLLQSSHGVGAKNPLVCK